MAAIRKPDLAHDTSDVLPGSATAPVVERSSAAAAPTVPRREVSRALHPAASDFLAASLSSVHESAEPSPAASADSELADIDTPHQSWGRALALSTTAWAGAAAAIVTVGGWAGGILAAFVFFGLPAGWLGWQLVHDRDDALAQ